jgi:hypothetical protein
MDTAQAIVLLTLAGISSGLTTAMFLSRNMMLGFPCTIFWAILGGYAYTLSSTPWGDWQYYLFMGAMGMTIFSMYAAYGLRERPSKKDDEFLDEGKDDSKYVDEDAELDKNIGSAFDGDEDSRGRLKKDGGEEEFEDERPKRRKKQRYGEFK